MFDGWRTTSGTQRTSDRTQRASSTTTIDHGRAPAVAAKIEARVKVMDPGVLEAFVESCVGSVVRDLGHWRNTGDPSFIDEAILSAQAQECGLREMLHRAGFEQRAAG